METIDDCGEVDVSAVFRQEASALIHVHNLESTLSKFGYAKGDRIERRELVLMYKKGRFVTETKLTLIYIHIPSMSLIGIASFGRFIYFLLFLIIVLFI
jgi:hypothetical protein